MSPYYITSKGLRPEGVYVLQNASTVALLNALIHRDYSYSDGTIINIFDNRIEFISIGGLVTGIELEDIMLGVSVKRNKNLADVFYRLTLIEAYGMGIPNILRSYHTQIIKPRIEVTNNAFKITLPNINEEDKLNNGVDNEKNIQLMDKEKMIMELSQNQQFIMNRGVIPCCFSSIDFSSRCRLLRRHPQNTPPFRAVSLRDTPVVL